MRDLVHKGMTVFDEYMAANVETHASSTAYFAFLSLVPTLVLCISLVSLTGFGEQEVVNFFIPMVPETFEDLIKALISDAFDRSGIAFSLSTVTLLWSASKGIKSLLKGLNVAFGVQETRSGFAVAAISVFAVIVLGVMVAGLMYLVFSHSLLRLISFLFPSLSIPSGLPSAIHPFAVLASVFLALWLCYTYLPAGKRSLSSQLPGAVAATVACGVLSFGFRLYVDVFSSYTVLYGSIATVALLLVWIYLVSYILVTCGFLNRMLLEGKLRLWKAE